MQATSFPQYFGQPVGQGLQGHADSPDHSPSVERDSGKPSRAVEAACSRANHYGTPGLNVVRRILEKGLDQQDLLAAFDALASTYTEGGRFYRATNTILQ